MIPSLKWRLVSILLALILFTWLVSALFLYFSSDEVLEGQVDNQLEQYSHMVVYICRVFARQIDEGLPLYEIWKDNPLEALHQRPMKVQSEEGLESLAVNIWLQDSLIAMLGGSPQFQQPAAAGFAYRVAPETGVHWRTLSQYDDISELWITVGIELAPARQMMFITQLRGMLPLLIVLPLTLLVVYIGVSRGLIPLNALVRHIAQRKAGQLDPLRTTGVPAEVAGVVTSINALMDRLALALDAEQRFTANAAHELTTPLAAIKAEVQLCQRQLRDSVAAERLSGISARVDRASHTVEQLLTLARLDPELPLESTSVPLRALLVEVLADTEHLAHDSDLQIDFPNGPEIVVSGNTEGLAILLRNLLVNAFRYATRGSNVQISLAVGEQVELHIYNACPPLSTEEFKRIQQRFYRVPGTAPAGAGLGLSIVERIATLHGAIFRVGAGVKGDGFCATLSFPRL